MDLTFIFFQALLQPELSETEVKMSEKTEKLVNIILPDLLNYLEMVESGEIIEKEDYTKSIFFRKHHWDDLKNHNRIESCPG